MAIMTPAGQRDALAALLATVSGVGVVYKRRRIVRDENTARQILVPSGSVDGKVNAWMIYPAPNTTTVTERHPGMKRAAKGGGNNITTMQWQIDAMFTVDDAAESEITAFDLAWAVADELNAYGVLDIPGAIMQLPADVEMFGFINMGNFVLYHYARISVAFQGTTKQA